MRTLCLVLLVAVSLHAHHALAEDTTSVEDILDVLAKQGLIDEDTHAKILTKHNSAEGKASRSPVASALLDGWDFAGDLRLRQESFWFAPDPTGFDETDRSRFRYRGRFKFGKSLYDWLDIGFRFVSGNDNPRGTNQTIGSAADFDTDDFRFDLAWLAYKPDLGPSTSLRLEGGKVPNPFNWKAGKDFMLWDFDLTLEGGSARLEQKLGESSHLFLNTGYYVAFENSTSSDPKLIAVQGGGVFGLAPALDLGVRASGYFWRSLDSAFLGRAIANGNLPTAFKGGTRCVLPGGTPGTRARCTAHIGSASSYLRWSASEDWPITAWGTVAKNFSAERGTFALPTPVTTSKQNLAWIGGIEAGDKARWVKLGLLFGHFEANALMAQFIDADPTDGVTNRRTVSFYGSRQIVPGFDFTVTLYKSDAIKDTGAVKGCVPTFQGGAGCGPYEGSIVNADRWRLQTDLIVRFD